MAHPYELIEDDRPKMGLVVLQSDETIEADMRRMLPPSVDLLVSRVPSATDVSSDSLQQMARVLTAAAGLFPAGFAFDVVGYGCTSGTAQIGAGTIASLIQKGTQARSVTEPVSALVAACRALGVTRIGLVSPYVAEVSDRLCAVLAENGITVVSVVSFDEPNEANVVRIAPASILSASRSLCQSHSCEAVFLSCTNLRTLDVIDDLETQTGLPVLSSNQVLAWHMQQQINAAEPGFAPGRIWQRPNHS